MLLASAAGIFWATSVTPTGFVPNEDRAMVFINVELPPGASMDRTAEVNGELYNKIKDIDGLDGVTLITGFSLIGGQGSNYGLGFIKLDDWKLREDESLSIDAITGKLFGVAATIPGANIIFFAPPSVPGFGTSAGFEFNLLDRSGGEFTDLDQVNQDFIMSLMQHPEI